MHPGTNMVATYYGMTWWDNEMDGEHMWPHEQRNPSASEQHEIQTRNLNAPPFAAFGLTSDFSKNSARRNSTSNCSTLSSATSTVTDGSSAPSSSTIARATCSTPTTSRSRSTIPTNSAKAVHLKDIHLEKGMQCIDCHFEQDNHGNGKLYGETRNAVEIDCVDCHGTIQQRATLTTSGFAAPAGGTEILPRLRTPWGASPFLMAERARCIQRSMLDQNKEWEVVQVLDTVTPGNSHYSEKSRLAKTIQKDGRPGATRRKTNQPRALQQPHDLLHLPHFLDAYLLRLPSPDDGESQMPMLHNEGLTTRN